MWAWKAGMLAQCVNNEAMGTTAPSVLRIGEKYEVESVWGECLILRGLREKENGWYAWRFRPVIERTEEQDVSMFKRIADSGPTETREVEREYSNPRVGV